MTTRVLDRIPYFDERSRAFNIRSLLPGATPRSYTWPCNVHLDQRDEGECVGFSWTHELAAKPKAHGVTESTAHGIYNAARKLDPWPGEDYEGTTVLAGAKAISNNGYMAEYRWAFNVMDALTWISRHGPAVLGTNWYEGMFDVDDKGMLWPTGDIAGGHAILIKGVSVTDRTVTLHNSWGRAWGVNGDAKITWATLETLFHQDGEICIPVTRF